MKVTKRIGVLCLSAILCANSSNIGGISSVWAQEIDEDTYIVADDMRKIEESESVEEVTEETEIVASEETSSEDMISEETSSEEMISEEIPSEETSSVEKPSEETPSEDMISDETTSEEISTEELPSEETSESEMGTVEVDEELVSGSIVKSGTITNGTWTIDDAGKLTIEGESFSYSDSEKWQIYGKDITSAYINAKPQDKACMSLFGDYTIDYIGTGKSIDVKYPKLTSIKFGPKFDTSEITNMDTMFAGCSADVSIELNKLNTSNVTSMKQMFFNCGCTKLDLSNFDTSKVQFFYNTFAHCEKLKSIDVSGFDTSSVKSFQGMFAGCKSLTKLDVSGFKTESAENMTSMFSTLENITELNLRNFNTKNVTSMDRMFQHCYKLKSLNLSSFDTSKVTTMEYMFYACSSLERINVEGFHTENVENMYYMFASCDTATYIDVSRFNTAKVGTMKAMFAYCDNLGEVPVGGFVTTRLTDIEDMFSGCINISSLDLSNWNLVFIQNSLDFIENCNSLSMIQTPLNLKVDISLPVVKNSSWIRGDSYGEISTLPKEQSTSILLQQCGFPTKITIDKKEVNLQIGAEAELKATVFPVNTLYKDIVWSSNTSSVADVQNGKIKAFSGGEATITAKSSKNNSVYATVTVYVQNATPNASVDGIYLNGLNQGHQYKIQKETVTADSIGRVKVDASWIGVTISIVELGVNSKCTSKAQKLKVTVDVSKLNLCMGTVGDYGYTGKAICPDVIVNAGDIKLRKGIDYTVSYSNNTNAARYDSEKAPCIIVKGKGKFKGTLTKSFNITPFDLDNYSGHEDQHIEVFPVYVKENGKVIHAKPKILYNGKQLSEKEYTLDYRVSGPDAYKNPGSYYIYIKGNGKNFVGETFSQEIIGKKYIKDLSISLEYSKVEYGSADLLCPKVTIIDKSVTPNKTLITGKDFRLSYQNADKIGIATVVITAVDDENMYLGTVKKTYKITGRKLTSDMFKNVVTKKTYDGSQFSAIDFSHYAQDKNGVSLVCGTDYDISYAGDLINVGTGKISFIGKGKYTGKITKTYRIEPKDICKFGIYFQNAENRSVKYTKGGAKTLVEVVNGRTELVEGRDYTVSYENNKKAAYADSVKPPKAVVIGKGNYKGKLTLCFTILKSSISDVTIDGYAKNQKKVNKSGNYKTTFTITDTDGRKLVAGTDYDKAVTYEVWNTATSKFVPVDMKKNKVDLTDGEIRMRIVVIGKGNYVGRKYIEYKLY